MSKPEGEWTPDIARDRGPDVLGSPGVGRRGMAWRVFCAAATIMLAVCVSRAQGAQEPAVDLLLSRCLASQERFDHVSVRGVTERGLAAPNQGRVEFWLRRDGDLLDISGTIRSFEPDDKPGYLRQSRFVATKDLTIRYYHDPTREIPRSGIAEKSKRDRERVRYLQMPVYSAALDGCLPGTDGQYAAELLLHADDRAIQGKEEIDHVPCTVVQGTTEYGRITLWIAEGQGFVSLKALNEKGPNDVYLCGETLAQAQLFNPAEYPGQSIVEHRTVVDRVAISEMGGIFTPTAGRVVETTKLSGGDELVSTCVCTRTEVDYEPDFAGTDAFEIDLANGSLVSNVDEKDSGVVYEWRDGRMVPAYTGFAETADGVWGPRTSLFRLVSLTASTLILLGVVIWMYYRRCERRRPSR